MKKIPYIAFETKQRSETIVNNTKLNDTRYSSWKAINIGTGVVTVDGVPLNPNEGIEHKLEPTQTWKEPINIEIQAGGKLQLLRTIVTPVVKYVIDKEG